MIYINNLFNFAFDIFIDILTILIDLKLCIK
jgi:hypothetical protein